MAKCTKPWCHNCFEDITVDTACNNCMPGHKEICKLCDYCCWKIQEAKEIEKWKEEAAKK